MTEIERGPLDFVVNGRLGGAPDPCASGPCRVAAVDKMARFAALYSDHVFVLDPFEKFVGIEEVDELVRWNFANEFAVLYHLRPLIEAGIAVFSISIPHFCFECSQQFADKDTDYVARLKTIEAILYDQYRDKVKAFAKRTPDRATSYELDVRGPPELIEHGHQYRIATKIHKSLSARLHRCGLRETRVRGSELDSVLSMYIAPIIDDVYLQGWHAWLAQCQYLTDRKIDIEVIRLAEDPGTQLKNKALIEGFAHSVPYVDNAPLSSLVELRNREGESFLVYRDALSSALKSVDLSEPDKVRQMFNDVVRPELNRLEWFLRNSRTSVKSVIGNEALIGLGAVLIGLCTGLLPSDMGNILATLGGLTALKSLGTKGLDLLREPKEVRENKYCFLWKASQAGKGR